MKRLLCSICLLSLLISGCQEIPVDPEASWGGFQISEDIQELQIVRTEESGFDESKVFWLFDESKMIWIPTSVKRKLN